MLKQRPVMFQSLTKAKAGVQNDSFLLNAHALQEAGALKKKITDLLDDIAIHRLRLHIIWLSLLVHKANCNLVFFDQCQRPFCLERVDVIYHAGTMINGHGHHFRLGSIHRHRYGEIL